MNFNVRLVIDIDEDDNILPVLPDMYEDAVKELIEDLVYDIDGAQIIKLEVKKR